MSKVGRSLIVRLLAVGMSICLTSSAWTAETAMARVIMPAGTPIVLKLLNDVNSSNVKTGETISLIVSNDVMVSGKVLVKQGTMVQGQVTKAKKAGAVGASGEVIISVQTVQAVDGATIPVNFTKSSEGESKMGTSIVLTLLCCFLFLLKKGENVGFSANTMFTALSIAPVEVVAP